MFCNKNMLEIKHNLSVYQQNNDILFGHYRTKQSIGQGRLTKTYLGEHIYLKSLAAIKVLPQGQNEEEGAAFVREAQFLERLKHPSIVRFLDFGVEDDKLYLVMEYACGGTLQMRHPQGFRVPLNTVIPYVRQLASALQYIHDQQIIHGNLKPDNILLDAQEKVRLSGFRYARRLGPEVSRIAYHFAEAPLYQAPEHLHGDPQPASDQYALAAIVYEWLSGHPLFEGNPLEIARQQVTRPLPPLWPLLPGISPRLEAVIFQALANNPQDRFATVQKFAYALQQAQQPVTLLTDVSSCSPVQAREAPVPPELRLCALGPIHITQEDKRIDTVSWGYAKVKELLFYLLDAPSRTKGQIGLALWPDADLPKLRNNLHEALHYLRGSLGHSKWIVYEQNCYTFNRQFLYTYDVDCFEPEIIHAHQMQSINPKHAIAILEHAVTLYRGDFLENLVAGEWVRERRDELRRSYQQALQLLGQLYMTQKQYEEAARSYRRLIAHDFYQEDAHRELMHCYVYLGEQGQALRHYQQMESRMRDELGIGPSAKTKDLVQHLFGD